MKWLDGMTLALGAVRAQKLRSALTMLGMIFGVGAVIAMMSIGAGAEKRAMEMIERMGVRNILVRGKQSIKRDDLEYMLGKALSPELIHRFAEYTAQFSLAGIKAVGEGRPKEVDVRVAEEVTCGAVVVAD